MHQTFQMGDELTVSYGNQEVNLNGKAPCFRIGEHSRMETFGKRLKWARDAKGWSQERLGYEVEVTGGTVSKWENDRAEPSLQHLAALWRTFRTEGVTLDFLIVPDVHAQLMVAAWKSIHESDGPAYIPDRRITTNIDEETLLIRFRAMDDQRRRALLALLKPFDDC